MQKWTQLQTNLQLYGKTSYFATLRYKKLLNIYPVICVKNI